MRRMPLATATVVALLIALTVGPGTQGGAVRLAVFLLAVTFATVVHEGGHCLAAKLVGLKVRKVTVGRGKPLLTVGVLGVPVVVGRVLGGGRTVVAGIAGVSRPRMSLFALGGVLANLAIGAVSAAVAAQLKLWPFLVLAFTNGCGLLNLIPFLSGEDALASDGLFLIRIWRRAATNAPTRPEGPEQLPPMLGLIRDPWLDQPASARAGRCCVCGLARDCQILPGPMNAAPGTSFPICGPCRSRVRSRFPALAPLTTRVPAP